MAQLIKTDGTVTEVKPANGKFFTLEEMQAFVGGFIQMVEASEGKTLVCNENGKNEGLPFNPMATLAYQFGRRDHIVGDALVCIDKDKEIR